MSQTYDDYENWEEGGQDSPLALVGILVMVLTSAAIIANALFMQPKSAEIDMIRQSAPQTTGAISPQKTISRSASSGDALLVKDHAAMTLAIQRQLTMAGYYVGPLDGAEGAQTREAIQAYQDAMGMAVTGRVSLELHDILTGRKSYQPMKSVKIQGTNVIQRPEVLEEAIVEEIAALPRRKPASLPRSAAPAAPRRLASKPQVPPQRAPSQGVSSQMARGPVPPENIPGASANSGAEDPVVKKVQSALRKYGYDGITVDGVMGSRTRAAIADFQRNRGHPVTGSVNDRLLQEMLIMGYLDLG